jgi:NAD(P)H-hydrate epimerase
VTVLAGPSGNGGGGLVAARHLANRGVAVSISLSKPDRLRQTTARQLDILGRIRIHPSPAPAAADVVLDALIGYGLQGDPDAASAPLIEWANGQGQPVLALDNPSGLDVTSGWVGDPCVRADATMTLALPKVGLRKAGEVVGRLFVADISVPPDVYVRFGLSATNAFSGETIVQLP